MTYDCKLYLCSDKGEKFFGLGPVRLLELVDQCGSVSQAAARMYMSYAKARRIIATAQQALGFPLLETAAGGAGGGGSALTDQARALLAEYRAYEAEAKALVAQCYDRHFLSLRGTQVK